MSDEVEAPFEIAQLQTNHGSFKIIAASSELDALIKGMSTPKWLTYTVVPENENEPRLMLSVKPSEVCFILREEAQSS